MWTKIYLVLLLANFYEGLKFDYEYKELILFCTFELMADTSECCSDPRYGCHARNLVVTTRDTQIEEVTGSHNSSRSNGDVATFYSFNPAAIFVPKRLGFVFPNLKILKIVKSGLKLIEFRDFKNMKKLQKLFLYNNKIEKLPMCVFRYAEKLEAIDLSGNRITELDENSFVNLPSLQMFSASDNQIGLLDKELFRNNPNLINLLLSNNEISAIGVNFLKMTGIQLVDLRYNNCTSLIYKSGVGSDLRDFQERNFQKCGGANFL